MSHPNQQQQYTRDSLIVQTLDVPLEENKPGVFAAFLRLQLKMADIISHELYNTVDDRAKDLVNLMISCIPNPKVRADTRARLKTRIEKEVDKRMDNEKQGRKMKDIYIEEMGNISDYMDRYMGGERRNRISFVIPMKDIRELMEKTNPEHFKEHLTEEDFDKMIIPIDLDESKEAKP